MVGTEASWWSPEAMVGYRRPRGGCGVAVGGRREPIREVAHCRRGRRGASEAAGSRWEALVAVRKSAREAKGRPS